LKLMHQPPLVLLLPLAGLLLYRPLLLEEG
jgi:hypothetical protein